MERTNPQPTTSILDASVRAKLVERVDDLHSGLALLLPSTVENGIALYSEFDTEARKIARSTGVNADFLFRSPERGYLHEYSADWLIALAIAVGQDVSVDLVRGVGSYIFARVRGLVSSGSYNGDEESAPIKVTIQRVARGADGEIEISGLTFEGEAQAVVESIQATLSPIAGATQPRQIEQGEVL